MKKISKDNCIYAMGPQNEPVLHISPGEQILFETWDALHSKSSFDDAGLENKEFNPTTGPVYVNGAETGDILSVRIDKIEVEPQGTIICGKGMGVMGKILEGHASKEIHIKDNMALFSDTIKLPLNKMIGVIGTSPAAETIPNSTPDYHGGNMDCKEVKEGATVLLPVNVPGALLALGDLHAVMADGEIGISGLEISGSAIVTVDIIKGKNWPLPMIVNDSHVMTLASHEDLDIAVDMAVANMVKYLQGVGFDIYDATMLISMVGDVQICQVVDPKKTIRVSFPKKFEK